MSVVLTISERISEFSETPERTCQISALISRDIGQFAS